MRSTHCPLVAPALIFRMSHRLPPPCTGSRRLPRLHIALRAPQGAVHGFAGVLGGMFPRGPHGGVVAALLPAAMRVTVAALRARAPAGSEALRRYADAARAVTGDPTAEAEDCAVWAAAVCTAVGIRGLEAYGVGEADCAADGALVMTSMSSSSMKGNPVVLTAGECRDILLGSLSAERWAAAAAGDRSGSGSVVLAKL